MPAPRMLFKITVLGDGGVGKTALTVQFTMSSFVETYDPTIEDCYRKQWVVDDQPCLLEVLDTAGQEEYTALRDQWIRDGEGFLIVYSIANRASYERVDRIVERVKRVKDELTSQASSPSPYGSPYGQSPTSPYGSQSPSAFPSSSRRRLPIVIVGNKKDLSNKREVTMEEGRAMAQRLGCEFYETSAKSNHNVENAFKSLVRGIKVSRGEGPRTGSTGQTGGGGRARKKKNCIVL